MDESLSFEKEFSDLREETKIETEIQDKILNNSLQRIGQSNIYLYQDTNGETIILKIINKYNLYPYESNQQLVNEIEIQKSIHYPGIIEIKDVVENNQDISIYYEYCQNGTLEQLINKRETNNLTEKEVQCYMLQLILSLNYLHINNIIHNNLNISNILLDKNMKLKIGSFRLAYKLETKLDKCYKIYEDYENSLFAPEVFKNDGYSFEVDIWSLGIIMFRLLTGKIPFIKDYNINYNGFIEPNLDISSAQMSKAAKDLINQLLAINPVERPTLNQIIYHDFFNREGIPKYFPVSTLSAPPEDFPKEVLNKEVIFTDLKSIIKPIIKPTITYDSFKDLKEIKDNNSVKDIDIYIKRYYNYISKYGVGYLMNNGFIGVYYRDKTKMIYNPNNSIFKYIDKNDEIQILKNNNNNSSELNNKIKILIRFENYFDAIKKKEEENKNIKVKNEINTQITTEETVSIGQNEENKGFKENEENEEDSFIYVDNIIFDNKFIFFKLSNQTQHIFYNDNIQIIMSCEVLTYIDREQKKCNLLLENVKDNPIKELNMRYNYIIYKYIKAIKKRLDKKFNSIKKKEEN